VMADIINKNASVDRPANLRRRRAGTGSGCAARGRGARSSSACAAARRSGSVSSDRGPRKSGSRSSTGRWGVEATWYTLFRSILELGESASFTSRRFSVPPVSRRILGVSPPSGALPRPEFAPIVAGFRDSGCHSCGCRQVPVPQIWRLQLKASTFSNRRRVRLGRRVPRGARAEPLVRIREGKRAASQRVSKLGSWRELNNLSL
jgi:hypothetical protein